MTSPKPDVEGLAKSRAFRDVALRSEVRRAIAVLGVIALVAIGVLSNKARQIDRRLILSGAVGLAILGLIQLGVLLYARNARRTGGMLPTWFVAGTIVIEALIPIGMMTMHAASGTLQPFTAMVSPPLLSLGIMITLATLRLKPWLCVLAGGVAAAGYLGLYAYASHSGRGLDTGTGLPRAAYVNFAILIFVAGIAAAWVAREIRGHMTAALTEAHVRARFEQDLGIARSIQRALLPRETPSIAGYEVAGWNRPADQTGGDYYDWQAMPDGNWIVTLADVSGHGIGPALVTAACRAYVRASSAHHGDLGSLNSRINALLSEDLPDGRFVTMATVLLQPGRDGVMLLSAGHGPIVMFVQASSTVGDIEPQDVPLAVIPDNQFGPAKQVEMRPGDVLALVTDGFVEWSRSGTSKREQYGTARLRESLKRHAGLNAAEIIEAIKRDVEAFAGGEGQQDDLTMVVVKRV